MSRLRTWATVAVVVVAAFAGSLAGFEWHRADSARSADDTRAEITSTAAGLATALFTYDYRKLSETQATISSYATGAFARREATANEAVQRQLLAAKAVGSAAVIDESVSDVSRSGASALVVLKTSASGTGGHTTTNEVYLHIHLTEVQGAWKVDEVQTLEPAS